MWSFSINPADKNSLHRYFFLGACLTWLVLFFYRADLRVLPLHDEAISFLAANAAESSYMRQKAHVFSDVDHVRGAWEEFSIKGFQDIRSDLEKSDIHPPIYFLLLNGWFFLFSNSLLSGLALNAVFSLACAGLIYRLCLVLEPKCSQLMAVAVGILWLYMPATFETAMYMRQHVLAALAVLMLLFSLCVFLRKPGFSSALFVAVSEVFCLMVSYQTFVHLVCANFCAFLLLMLAGRRRDALVLLLIACLAALTFTSINPGYLQQLGQQQGQVDVTGTAFLVAGMVENISSLFLYTVGGAQWQKSAALLVTGVIFSILGLAAWKYFQQIAYRKNWLQEKLPLLILASAGLSFLGHVVLYLTQVFPDHAIQIPYLTVTTPLLVLGAFLIWERSEIRRGKFFLVVVAISLAGGHFFNVAAANRLALAESDFMEVVNQELIVADTVRRGVFIRAIWKADADAKVLAGHPATVLTELSSASRELPKDLAYVHSSAYSNPAAAQAEIIGVLHASGYKTICSKVLSPMTAWVLSKDANKRCHGNVMASQRRKFLSDLKSH